MGVGSRRRRQLTGLLLILLLVLLLILLIKLLLVLLVVWSWSALKAGLLARKFMRRRELALSGELPCPTGKFSRRGKSAGLRRCSGRFSTESHAFCFVIGIAAII